MTAFIIKNWKLVAVGLAIAALVIGFAVYRQSLINEGWDRALEKVKEQNHEAGEAARKIQRTVDDCYNAGGVWSTITGECSR